MSRPLIESIVRERVERHSNITICQRCRARFVVPTSDGAGVAVQNQLAAKARRHRSKVDAAEPSLLTGLLADVHGNRLTPLLRCGYVDHRNRR
jgi:hypothetical protein